METNSASTTTICTFKLMIHNSFYVCCRAISLYVLSLVAYSSNVFNFTITTHVTLIVYILRPLILNMMSKDILN